MPHRRAYFESAHFISKIQFLRVSLDDTSLWVPIKARVLCDIKPRVLLMTKARVLLDIKPRVFEMPICGLETGGKRKEGDPMGTPSFYLGLTKF